MALCLQVIYPIADGTRFNWAQYLGTHAELVG